MRSDTTGPDQAAADEHQLRSTAVTIHPDLGVPLPKPRAVIIRVHFLLHHVKKAETREDGRKRHQEGLLAVNSTSKAPMRGYGKITPTGSWGKLPLGPSLRTKGRGVSKSASLKFSGCTFYDCGSSLPITSPSGIDSAVVSRLTDLGLRTFTDMVGTLPLWPITICIRR